jgi:ribosome-associated protein
MATTKKNGAGRPKIASSHARQPTPRKPAGGAKKAARPAPGKAAARPTKPKKGPAEKPSRIAARSTATANATQRPSRARSASVEVRTEAAEESKSLALLVAKAALDKKAVNIEIVDVVGRVDYADFLVLMSGRSDRHVLAVADSIEEELSRLTPKRRPIAVEGRPEGHWVLLDFGEVVAHVFQEEARSFYDLDTLWQDARKVPVSDRMPAS